jgi:hypothetical protein
MEIVQKNAICICTQIYGAHELIGTFSTHILIENYQSPIKTLMLSSVKQA